MEFDCMELRMLAKWSPVVRGVITVLGVLGVITSPRGVITVAVSWSFGFRCE